MATKTAAQDPDMMEAVLDLSPEEARTYSMILDAASSLPKNDPRFALTLTFTWWLLHRRRRLEQQRVRRRQFYRRLRRLIFLRWHLQKNTVSSAVALSGQSASVKQAGLVPDKRIWMKKELQNRSEDFWKKVDQNLLPPEAFRKLFHMSRETFDYVYDELADQLQKSNTTMRDSLPGKKRLAATIYRMATNAEYIKVAALFGIGKSTTTSLVRDVCEVIVSNLKDKFLTFIGEGYNPSDMKRKVEEAATKFGIPRAVGILGSIDVMIIGSSWDWSDNSPYISSYHKNYAVTFQAVVDSEGRFCHVIAGGPSSLTNKQILKESGLQKEFVQKFTLAEEQQKNEESGETASQRTCLAARILSDESYGSKNGGSETNEDNAESNSVQEESTSTDWLLTPEEVENESQDENEQQLMLEKITQARDIFDDAVFNVKSRWKLFHGKNGKINFSADAFEKIALACCILHNICELQDDKVDPSWGNDIGPEVYNRKGYPKETATPGRVDEEEEDMDGEGIEDEDGVEGMLMGEDGDEEGDLEEGEEDEEVLNLKLDCDQLGDQDGLDEFDEGEGENADGSNSMEIDMAPADVPSTDPMPEDSSLSSITETNDTNDDIVSQ